MEFLTSPDSDITERAAPRFTALLVALAVFAGALWVRGRFVSDTIRLGAGGGVTLHAFCGRGSLAFAVTRGGEYFKKDKDGKAARWSYAAARPPIDFHARWTALGNETRFNRAGVVTIREPSRGTELGLLVPATPVAGAVVSFALVRVLWFRLFTRRRRRLAAGLCPACGNDMHALADRCSHCGRARSRGGMRITGVRNATPKRHAA